MELNEREAHCVARLLQGAILGENVLTGCDYCKNRCYETQWDILYKIRERLTEETGVELGNFYYGTLPHSDFPYKMFLKNASDKVKDYYRARFNYLVENI